MPSHTESRRVPYSARQMYKLVADVERYPEFLPWTTAARIRETRREGSHVVMLADLVVSFKVFSEEVWQPGHALAGLEQDQHRVS